MIGLPEELRAIAQWVAWRAEPRVSGKPAKVPYSAVGVRASSTDPTTWLSHDDAVRLDLDGVGFVFSATDPYCGIDLDHVLTPDGSLAAQATEIVEALDSYTEWSPSGGGLHIIARASLAGKVGNRKGSVELYDRGRFFALTGDVLDGRATIHERQRQVDALHDSLFASRPAQPPVTTVGCGGGEADDALLDRARRASNGAKFSTLFDAGDWQRLGYPSQSEADFALASLLAFWTADAEQVDRLFRRSALMRPKWERVGARTIGRLLAGGAR